MTPIHVGPFRGEVPRVSDRLLSANQATAAVNCKITAGRLDPLKGLGLVHTSLAPQVETIFRYKFGSVYNWLVWSRVVDALLSTTVQDDLGRFYYTGDGEPRMSTYARAISGPGPYPAAFYVLGVAPPVTSPSLAVVGGTAPTETRSYVYTFKTALSEESPPSAPVGPVTGNANGSWNLSGLETAMPNSGTVSAATTVATGVVEVTLNTVRGLFGYEEVTFSGVVGMTDLNGTFPLVSVDTTTGKVRVALTTAQTYTSGGAWARVAPHNTTGMTKVIYRQVGANENFFRVAEIPVANTTYNDTIPGSALEEELPTLNSSIPPKNLHSFRALANGCFAGLADNELCFSETSKPYSWPLSNRYAFAGKGVGLSVVDNSVIVLTDTKPIVATATVPEAVSMADLPTYAPCVSKLSIADVGEGCLYAGHDGLYLATPAGVRNATNLLYRFDEWTQLVPETFKATFFDQRYYAMHDFADGSPSRIFELDLAEPDSVLQIDERVDNLYTNPWDGKMYAAKDQKIYEWDSDDANRYTTFWQSLKYQQPTPINYGCAQVFAEYGEITPINTSIRDANTLLLALARNARGCLNGAPVNSFAVNGSNVQRVPAQTMRQVQFTLLADDVPVYTTAVASSNPFRLPSGFRSEIYGFQISSSVKVHTVGVAQTMDELKKMA